MEALTIKKEVLTPNGTDNNVQTPIPAQMEIQTALNTKRALTHPPAPLSPTINCKL